jgi:hypothetical protein
MGLDPKADKDQTAIPSNVHGRSNTAEERFIRPCDWWTLDALCALADLDA